MASASPFQRLLRHAQHVFKLSRADEILAASSVEVLAMSGAERTFASCCLPGKSWDQGSFIAVGGAGRHPVSAAGRSALFAIHRRVLYHARTVEISRDPESTAIFEALECPAEIAVVLAVPIIHRTGRIWGEFVVIGGAAVDGLSELAHFATIALENAQRLAFARRDQDRLLLLAEATDDAFYDYDLDTRDFWWGGGIRSLYGSDADPVENSERWKLERIHPEDVGHVRAAFEQARSTNAMRWEGEYRFRRHDGTYRHVEDRAYFLRDVTGRVHRMLGVMRDVTLEKELLSREQCWRADAERANRAKDEFLAMLGHELRNPLAPIVSGLELLRLRGHLDPARDLPVLTRQAQHLIRLVDDLLDISRIASGKIELKRERVEIATVIAAAIETASPLVEGRNHRLDVEVPSSGLEVHVDRARMAQALANLLINAAKYTEPGGQITVAAERDGDAIAVRVRDSGIGISPAMLPRVFTMFVQERQALDRSQGGLGIGLSIVRSLVDLHNGTVEARSEGVGRGSEFIVRLPAACTTDAVQAEARPEPAEVRAQSIRILVVDDNEDAAEMLAELLEGLGHTTEVAHDAPYALRAIAERPPHLAILDIGLPHVDGYELARQIRACGQTLPLVALTGYGQTSDKERALGAGFDAHMVKPASFETLRTVIERFAPRASTG